MGNLKKNGILYFLTLWLDFEDIRKPKPFHKKKAWLGNILLKNNLATTRFRVKQKQSLTDINILPRNAAIMLLAWKLSHNSKKNDAFFAAL